MASSSGAQRAIRQPSPSPPATDSMDMAFEATEMSFDAISVASGSSDESSSAPTRRPMKNASRERMKAETTFLRARVQDLERELSQTLAKKALERCTMPSPAWRDLAKRQAARREKSEQERDRLRARLLHQLQVAKSLETIFRNRSGAFIDDLCASAAASGHKAYPVDNLAQLHDRFMDEIDALFPLVDAIFADRVELSQAMGSSLRRSTVVSQQANGDEEKLYVELRNAMYVPFPFERVCGAMWRAITTEFSREGRLVERYRCTDDEYSGTFFSQNNAPGQAHNFVASIVMRNVNWDRTPGIPREYGDETGWITVEPTSASSGEGVIVRVCTRYVPIWEVQTKLIEAGALRDDNEPSEQNFRVGEVTNRVLNGTEEDIAAITESIENILLDESIGAVDDDLAAMLDDLETLHDHSQDFDSAYSSIKE